MAIWKGEKDSSGVKTKKLMSWENDQNMDKMVLVADENDNRHRRDNREPINTRFVQIIKDREIHNARCKDKANWKPYPNGWNPPITVYRATKEEIGWEEEKFLEELGSQFNWMKKTAGAFHAMFRANPDGTYRIACCGGDDTGFEKDGMNEVQGRRIWARLNDFVTIRTLWNLGFHWC